MARHLVVLLAPALLLCLAHPGPAQDLPANPGFEQTVGQPPLPAEWIARSVTLPAHRLVPEARTGEWGAQIRFTEGTGSAVSGYYYSRSEPLTACKRLSASAWVKVHATEGQGAYVRLFFWRDRTLVGSASSPFLADSTGEWRLLEVSAVPPAEADSWQMSVEFTGLGSAVFDDAVASLEPLDLLPRATRDAPAGRPMDLGGGHYGVLGPVSAVTEGRRATCSVSGRSAAPPALFLGAVWYSKERNMGVFARPLRAWAQDSDEAVPVRPLAAADALRPVVYARSQESFEAATVGEPVLEPVPSATLPALSIRAGPHPRLFATAAELERLRALVSADPATLPTELQPLAALYAKMIALADRCFEEQEIVVYSGRYRTSVPPAEPPRHEDDFPYWTGLSRAIEQRICSLATAYLLSGERRYADLCRSWTLALCEWPAWNDPDFSCHPSCLDTGHLCYAVAFAYDFIHDTLTQDERRTIREALLSKGAQAVMDSAESGWAKTMGWPNGFAVVMGGMGIAGLAALEEDERAAGYVRYARQRLHDFMEARDRDGGYVEGLVYGGYAMSYLTPFAATLANHGDNLLDGHRYMAATLKFATYCLHPATATSVNFCDSTYEVKDYNPLAAWRACRGDGAGLWYLLGNQGLERLMQYMPPLSVLWYPRGVTAQSPASRPPAAHYRDIGWAVLRSGFEEGDSLLALRAGYHGSHCQLDQNSFMLCVRGTWLLSDPGYGQTPTEVHSTLLVGGKGQAAAGGSMTAFGTIGRVSYAAGDASGCYDGLSRFTRHVVMVDRDYYVIIDELAPEDGAVEVISQLVTADEAPRIGADGNVVLGSEPTCALALPPDPGETRAVRDRNSRLQTAFTLTEPLLAPMVLQPGRGEDARPVRMAREGDAALVRVGEEPDGDYLLLNPAGDMVVMGLDGDRQLATDGRLLWVRMRGGQVAGWSLVWGSKAAVGERLLVDEATRADREG